MNAEFFVLAFTAALNPKLLAVDLLLIENRRPRAMFLCVLLGGITVGLTVGLLDVLVFHLDAISSQKTVSAGVDLALGLLLLVIGALMATGRLHARRKAATPAQATVPPAAVPDGAVPAADGQTRHPFARVTAARAGPRNFSSRAASCSARGIPLSAGPSPRHRPGRPPAGVARQCVVPEFLDAGPGRARSHRPDRVAEGLQRGDVDLREGWERLDGVA